MTGEDFDQSSNKRKLSASKAEPYNDLQADDEELARKIQKLEQSNRETSSSIVYHDGPTQNTLADRQLRYQEYMDASTPWNFIPKLPPSYRKDSRFSNILELEDAHVDLATQTLIDDKNILLKLNTTIFTVSDPPGEPYYIGKVLEFVCKPEFKEKIDSAREYTTKFPAKFFQLRMNWFYRPRDCQKDNVEFDPRLVYASMNVDICPLESYRGKCIVMHKDEITDVLPSIAESYSRSNCFYFDQLYDKYTSQFYNVWSTHKLLNMFSDSSYLYALSKRIRYVYSEIDYPFMELIEKYIIEDSKITTIDSLNNWDKRCSICKDWCDPGESNECTICGYSTHNHCLPNQFDNQNLNIRQAHICEECSLMEKDTQILQQYLSSKKQKEITFIENERNRLKNQSTDVINTNVSSNTLDCQFQYLGCHLISRLEDVLQRSLDLPYPFKSPHIGSQYQWIGCNTDWSPRPYANSGFIEERGVDHNEVNNTSQLIWKMDNEKSDNTQLEKYIKNCKEVFPEKLKIQPENSNFLDTIAYLFMTNDYNFENALQACNVNLSRKLLKLPTFTKDENGRFEKAVKKYGNDLLAVQKEVASQPLFSIVQFFYSWKETPIGKRVLGYYKVAHKIKKSSTNVGEPSSAHNIPRRKRKKSDTEFTLTGHMSELEVRYIDDSSIDTESNMFYENHLTCLFCALDYSPMWYKVTSVLGDDVSKPRMKNSIDEAAENFSSSNIETKKTNALCIRCARLWRRYGIQWQHPIAIMQKLHNSQENSLSECISQLFDETNDNHLLSSPHAAHIQSLEWELVQDAEMIVRQRLEIWLNLDDLKKLKRIASTNHKLIYKKVKKWVDKYAYYPSKMNEELDSFIKQSKIATKNKKSSDIVLEALNKSGISSGLPSIQNLTNEYNDSESQTYNSIASEGSNISILQGSSTDLMRGMQQNYSRSARLHSDISLKVKGPNNSTFKIEVDQQFTKVKLAEALQISLDYYLNFAEKSLSTLDSSSLDTIRNEALEYLKMRDLKENPRDIENNKLNTSVLCRSTLDIATSCNSNQLFLDSNLMPLNKKCSVCYSEFTMTRDKLSCTACGLAVHFSCYGIDPPKFTSPINNWNCDTCKNSHMLEASTNQQCVLCPKLKIAKPFSTNSVKMTSYKTWCHILCALFNRDITFEDSHSLKPIFNTEKALLKENDISCKECKESFGSLVNCYFCDTQVHPKCAASNEAYILRFLKQYLGDNSGKVHLTDKRGLYSLEPVVCCTIHSDFLTENSNMAFVPFNMKPGDHTKSYLQLYCETYKASRYSDSIEARFHEYDDSIVNSKQNTNQLSSIVISENANAEFFSLTKAKIPACLQCGNIRSVRWFNNGNLCLFCHLIDNDTK